MSAKEKKVVRVINQQDIEEIVQLWLSNGKTEFTEVPDVRTVVKSDGSIMMEVLLNKE
jgi:hypothetical protein